MPDKPRFSTEDIKAILSEASQRQQARQDDPEYGLSLHELEKIAEEAGIAPEFVRAAVESRRQSTHVDDAPSKFWGGPKELYRKRVYNVALPAKELDAILVPTIRKSQEVKGQFETLGPNLHWSNAPAPSGIQTDVNVTTGKGQTTVEIHTKGMYNGIMMAQIPAIIMAFLTFLSLISPKEKLHLTLPFFVVMLVLYAAGHWAYGTWARRKQKNNLRLEEDLSDAIERYTAHLPQATTESLPQTAPVIQLDETETPNATQQRTERRRTLS